MNLETERKFKEGKLKCLDSLLASDYAQEFKDWCDARSRPVDEDTAEFFIYMKNEQFEDFEIPAIE